MTWGVESHVIERFTGAGIPQASISFARDAYVFEYPGSPGAFLDIFRNFYGPTMNAFEAAQKSGRTDDLQSELRELFDRQNSSALKDETSIPATFLRVTVRVD